MNRKQLYFGVTAGLVVAIFGWWGWKQEIISSALGVTGALLVLLNVAYGALTQSWQRFKSSHKDRNLSLESLRGKTDAA